MIAFRHTHFSYSPSNTRRNQTFMQGRKDKEGKIKTGKEARDLRLSMGKQVTRIQQKQSNANANMLETLNSNLLGSFVRNKKAYPYRKLTHRRITDRTVKTQQGVDNQKQTPFKCYNEEQNQNVKKSTINHGDDKLYMILKWSRGSGIKGKSFQQFIEQKRRKDAMKRREQLYSLRGTKVKDIQIQQKVPNISGKGIKHFKEQKQPSQIQKVKRQESKLNPIQKRQKTPTPLQQTSRVYTIQPKSNSKNESYIKYMLGEDQGYCLFHKFIYSKAINQGRLLKDKKKTVYAEKQKKTDRILVRSFTGKPNSGKIEGWAVNSIQDQQLQ